MRFIGMILATVPLLGGLASAQSAQADEVKVFAAGSLKVAMGELTAAFHVLRPQTEFSTQYGASGLLRERIETGADVHVFASADLGNTKVLEAAGRTDGPPVIFARNRLCALARDGMAVSSQTLLAVLLDPGVRVGISTPRADPSGDYAMTLFAKAEAVKAGARSVLESKALKLTGGPASVTPPEGRNVYGWLMASGKADVFLTYCTNAAVAKSEVASLQVIGVPDALAVGAEYGLVLLKGHPEVAATFAGFVMSEAGQALLVKHGFGRGDAANK
jgi:molybdate transport system substrate-binding protein